MDLRYECPWCGHAYRTEYDINLHIEEQHTEDSPFSTTTFSTTTAARTVSSSTRLDSDCKRSARSKHIPSDAADLALTQPTSSTVEPELTVTLLKQKAKRVSQSQASKHDRSTATSVGARSQYILGYLSGRSSSHKPNATPLRTRKEHGRLGTKELGQYAYEMAMPSSVRRVLEDAARPVLENRISQAGNLIKHIQYPNETSGLIPILADICALDASIRTYFCHPEVKHIHRLRCDGNFCGYWNIQMLLIYILSTTAPERGLPTVLQIQETIEQAWSNNICPYARIETGGILNTRKWIGTHEALAFFRQLGIAVSASSFKPEQTGKVSAYSVLLDFVEAYFLRNLTAEPEEYEHNGSIVRQLPPIFLQRAGHSMTIVGMTRHDNGKRSLLVFDPSNDTTPAMSRLLAGRSVHALPESLLQPYRRSEARMASWDEYEALM